MDLVLIPGLWLTAASWDDVIPALEASGHRTHPLTLPGMQSVDADRSGVSLRDQVDAVVATIDSLDGPVVLVGHSMGGAIAHAAADARPDLVARVVHVASEPHGDGDPSFEFPADGTDVPLPDWDFFDAEMTADLDDDLRARIRAGSVPSPLRATTESHKLSDDRRYDVPATLIAAEYSSAQLQEWVAQGMPGTAELGAMRKLEYVDLPGGHWPQYAQPDALAALILAAIED